MRHIQIHNCKLFRVINLYTLNVGTIRRYCIILRATLLSVVTGRRMEGDQYKIYILQKESVRVATCPQQTTIIS